MRQVALCLALCAMSAADSDQAMTTSSVQSESCTDKMLMDADTEVMWESSTGTSCYDHESLSFCTEEGEPGVGWDVTFGSFAEWKNGGLDATQACCACGGGVRTEAYHVVVKDEDS